MTAIVSIKDTTPDPNLSDQDPGSELRASQEREQWLQAHFKALSHYLLVEQEAERRSLSRTLHDRIGQSLTAAIINLQTAQMMGEGIDDDTLEQTCRTLSECLTIVREMEINLRPSQLDDLGLKLAVEAYLQRSLTDDDVRYSLDTSNMDERFDPRVETAAFRIIQDIVKLCSSVESEREIRFNLTRNDNRLELDIECLFADESRDMSDVMDGNKVLGIRERTAMLRGEADIQIEANQARLHIQLPTQLDAGFDHLA